MEKSSKGDQMDLDEWEFLSDDAFLDLHHHHDHHQDHDLMKFDPSPKGVFNMNYFICPSPKSHRIDEQLKNSSDSKGPSQVIPVPIQLEPTGRKITQQEEKEKEMIVKEVIKVPILEINLVKKAVGGDHQEMVSQVFFKKPKGPEFGEMKMDSPRGIKPQIDVGSIHHFEEKEDQTDHKSEATSDHESMPMKNINSDEKINMWRWRLDGIGALCSMGVAAATICIFILGSHHQRHKHHQQKLKFQIYADDKRIKQVVHHASKLNQAFSAVRGLPATRAHVTFGGYYEGL